MTHDIPLADDSFNSSDDEAVEESKASEKLILVKQLLERLQSDLNKVFQILSKSNAEVLRQGSDLLKTASRIGSISQEGDSHIIEGVFDGQNMIGPDGKQYSVPANYASKSKLIEGDVLKLTIQPDGRFVYKQIGPQERVRVKGVLQKDAETGEFEVLAEGKKYKVILASVTYFKGEPGDEVIILLPKEKNSAWAAVENIVKGAGGVESDRVAKLLDFDVVEDIRV
ncbi:hypothetical protein KKD19_04945 [Patescibacteria group bacterium]|nr:hypothetical protein [Patescibacteria group bacterium]MBU4512557.1 hypothetical protein [Patescibacteria group bacterium]MCG2693057.1 hypothetical protein [Candidatus Parcubacteria bacterium]